MQPKFHIAVIDTETTGLSANSDRLVEVAVQLLHVDHTGQLLALVDVYQSLHDPGMRIPRHAMAVHGITDAMVKGHKIDAQRLDDILQRADLVVAHNSGFDKGFVRQVVPHCDQFLWACSCRGIAWKQLYTGVWSAGLGALASRFRLQQGTAHRALGDVETTVNLLLELGPDGRPHLAILMEKKLGRRLQQDVVNWV